MLRDQILRNKSRNSYSFPKIWTVSNTSETKRATRRCRASTVPPMATDGVSPGLTVRDKNKYLGRPLPRRDWANFGMTSHIQEKLCGCITCTSQILALGKPKSHSRSECCCVLSPFSLLFLLILPSQRREGGKRRMDKSLYGVRSFVVRRS